MQQALCIRKAVICRKGEIQKTAAEKKSNADIKTWSCPFPPRSTVSKQVTWCQQRLSMGLWNPKQHEGGPGIFWANCMSMLDLFILKTFFTSNRHLLIHSGVLLIPTCICAFFYKIFYTAVSFTGKDFHTFSSIPSNISKCAFNAATHCCMCVKQRFSLFPLFWKATLFWCALVGPLSLHFLCK